MIKALIKESMSEQSNELVTALNVELRKNIDIKIKSLERNIEAYLETKFDEVTNKVAESLINRKFNEEVNSRANKFLKKSNKSF